MEIKLTATAKSQLQLQHRTERDKRIYDRIKAILVQDAGWSIAKICQALHLAHATVSRYWRESLATTNVVL